MRGSDRDLGDGWDVHFEVGFVVNGTVGMGSVDGSGGKMGVWATGMSFSGGNEPDSGFWGGWS